MKAKVFRLALALMITVASLAAAVLPAAVVSAATINVPGDYLTIAAAVAAANPAGGDTIVVAAGTYNEHDITIDRNLTIEGAGADVTIVDGQNLGRVFLVSGTPAPVVAMSGITVRNGYTDQGGGVFNDEQCTLTMTDCTVSGNTADWGGGGISNYYESTLTMTNCTVSGNTAAGGSDGGGILNASTSTLTMTDCTVSGNTAGWLGGGIFNYMWCTLTMTNCTVSGNTAGWAGGGIRNSSGCTLTMTDCTVSGNTAVWQGGGICNIEVSTLTMTDCTVSGNTASGWAGGGILNYDECTLTMTGSTVSGNTALDYGGGIFNNDMCTLTMTNCTVSGNTASSVDSVGGGIYNYYTSTLALTNCTVSGNSADYCGGIHNYNYNSPDQCTLTCTIVYGNDGRVSDDNVCGPHLATECIVDNPDPRLGPLQDNGGPTQTQALLPGSAAIDRCVNNCTVTTDQRGVPRPQGDHCDIGAYEAEPQPPPPVRPPTVPTLSLWGTAGLAVVLGALLAWTVKRRLHSGSSVR